MKDPKVCVLDDNKICDDCGECNRCDLDPEKICDNCCRCIAMEDEGKEFRSRIVPADGSVLTRPAGRGAKKPSGTMDRHVGVSEAHDLKDEPSELTPELVDYWEKKLLEYGEAPADDGFGEIEVGTRVPVYGKRPARKKHTDD